ncbi:MAG: hypothetical protein Q7R73_04160 [bacterium]|nr:hypothetical protein [bacterium]
MNKILIFFIVLFAVFSMFYLADARTNCDDQAKPALACPTGYSMMCNPTGGYHWGCGKESRDGIAEWTSFLTPAEGSAVFQNNESNLDFIQRATEAVGGDVTRESDSAVSNESVQPDARAPVNINTVSSERISLSVVVKKVQVRGWDPKQKEEFLATVKTHAQVRSGQDLENFARGVLVRDENVESVTIGEEGVQFSYRMPAKLFGIFNASLVARVDVDAESRVKVRFPWLRIFFSEPVGALKIQESVEKELGGVTQTMQTQVRESEDNAELANIDLQNKIQYQAQILQLLSNIMKAQHDTAMSVIRNMK